MKKPALLSSKVRSVLFGLNGVFVSLDKLKGLWVKQIRKASKRECVVFLKQTQSKKVGTAVPLTPTHAI